MSVYLVVLTGLLCFCLGATSLALLAWLSLSGEDPNVESERRQAELHLQRMTHAAMVQMLAEARQARFGHRRTNE